MDFQDITSISSLKQLGTIETVVSELQKIVAPFKVEAQTYEELIPYIDKLKEKWIDFIPGPFVSPQAEAIFYLTKLEGKQRNNLLQISEKHYEDRVHAQKWYHTYAKLVHPDNNGNEAAFAVLSEIYKIMTED